MDTIEKKLGGRVRELRKVLQISQEELAYKAGIHRTYLGGIERGERNPSLRKINAIAVALDINLVELFQFSPPKRD